jgi:hypothetical protein
MIKYTIINIIISTIFTLITTYSVKHFIEKHSVHPQYGNYKNVGLPCSPWDSCD